MTKNQSPNAPLLILEKSIARAWGRALLYIMDNPGIEISPLVLSIQIANTNIESEDDLAIKKALDSSLLTLNETSIEDVAFTIFPERYWKMAQGERAKLFQAYAYAIPRFKAMNRSLNGRGLYFERLIMYGKGPCDGNQLEWILTQSARKGTRRSMFQASIFDPERDHVPQAQLGFPCLQHVSFTPTSSGLVMNAFYATQQLYNKAYGNYLGLIRLGQFMAHEMKMPFLQLNVMVGVLKLEKVTKQSSQLKPIIELTRKLLDS